MICKKQIETEILNKAKKNILELTSDYSKAESVTRMLSNNERFQMNKIFPQLKKKYSDTFGLNNKNLDDVEMSQFIKNEVESGQALTSPAEKVEKQKISTKLRQFKKAQLEAIIDELNRDDPALRLKKGTIKEMVDELDSKDVYDAPRFRTLLRIPDVYETTAPIMPVAPTLAARAPVSSLSAAAPAPTITLTTEESEGLTPADIEARKAHLAAVEINRLRPKIDPFAATLKKSKPKGTAEATSDIALNPLQESMLRRRAAIEPDEVMTASGIKNHVLPSTVPFGKIALDLNKLFYQNILSIKRHNGNKIIGHKNKRVSDNFVDIIMKMFENKPITQYDLKNIKDEQMLYDNLIVQSGLHKLKKVPTNIEQTSEQMKNRLGLITGEIEAGNSNKSLLTELHELLFKMVRVHLISKNAAAAYYKNIKDQFYTL